jgi:hypothetical protein
MTKYSDQPGRQSKLNLYHASQFNRAVPYNENSGVVELKSLTNLLFQIDRSNRLDTFSQPRKYFSPFKKDHLQ